MSQVATTSLLPWQQSEFKHLQMLQSNDRLAHGWLFSGPSGIGKLGFARHVARWLLCRKRNDGNPCGQCQDCHLVHVRTHPDLALVLPEALEQALFPDDSTKSKEKPSRQLKVEQVREAIGFAQGTAQRGGAKVVVLCPAEAMNINSANALLKILEEPPERTYLLLVSEQPLMLLATLRSRCQQLEFKPPATESALAWLRTQPQCPPEAEFLLQLAQGAPLHAMQLAANAAGTGFLQLWQTIVAVCSGSVTPVQAAKSADALGIHSALEYQLLGLGQLLKSQQSGTALALKGLQPLQVLFENSTGTGLWRRLHALYQSLLQARKIALASNNANALLMLETLFAQWSAVGSITTARRN